MSTQEDNFTEIADAIRYKEMSSATIPANTFADRVMGLSCRPWEYPSDWPDPEQLIADAIADADDANVKSGFVMFFGSSEETYTLAGAKYLYGSDGQKITGPGGTGTASITFSGDSYEVKASGRAIRWVVILQNISETYSYIGTISVLPVSCINIYVSKACYQLYCPGQLLTTTTTYLYQLESIVFGRDNADDQNQLYMTSSVGVLQNLCAFIAIVNGKIKLPSGVRAMTNWFVNCYNIREYPRLEYTGTNQYYSPTNLGNYSYSVRGIVYIPISAYTSSHNFQNFFGYTGVETIHFNNSVSSIRVTTFTYALRYAQNLKRITCDSSLTIDIANAPLYFAEFAYSLESIEPILDCTNMGSSSLNLFNNTPATQTRSYAIKSISIILSAQYSHNLTRTMHCADMTSWQFLASNAPDVTASPLTLTIGTYLQNKLNATTEGQAVLSALTGKGWVIA